MYLARAVAYLEVDCTDIQIPPVIAVLYVAGVTNPVNVKLILRSHVL